MNEEDIKKQLEVKNKEIYQNKLNLDLNNNLEVLVLTIDNLLNNMEKESVNKILGIAETFQNETYIRDNIHAFLDNYREYLMTICDEQKNNLLNLIDDNKRIEEYKKYLKDNIIKIKEQLNNYFDNSVEILINKLQNLFKDSFCNIRIEEYLKNIFKDNLNNKVLDTINSRDIILINTFKESYLKYQELNKNTVGIE